jgi:hypothetical protein
MINIMARGLTMAMIPLAFSKLQHDVLFGHQKHQKND